MSAPTTIGCPIHRTFVSRDGWVIARKRKRDRIPRHRHSVSSPNPVFTTIVVQQSGGRFTGCGGTMTHLRTQRSLTAKWAALFLSSFLPLFFAANVFAQSGGPDDPPGTIARIGYLDGGVSLQPSGTDDWSQAPVNYPMIPGDRIYTGPGSRADIQLGGAELRVWQLTDVTLVNQADNFQQIGLASGNLRLRVFQMDPGSQIEVDTPNGAVIVESAGDYRIEAFPQNGSSIFTVNNGNAAITGPGINQPVSTGYSVGLFGVNPVEIQYLNVPDYDDLDYWSLDLDQRLQNSISARYVSREMVGYGDLDANGTWDPQSEYGPVWYPNNVPYGWRPYSTGHWAYVQPWGYTWVDDAPWGFAPFHYGRWTQIGGRWGWTPGPPQVRPVYSPALVAFVGGGPGGGGFSLSIGFGGGGGVAAWFPIGVGEPYVPWYRCSPNYARQVNVSNVNVAVIRNTTIVNNYNTYINKTVINNTTINNTTVNNFNYANRSQVTAVPASAMASGTSVTRQAVQLTPQQRQQIATAPISVRPTAPVPATPHPSLAPAAQNIARPAAARPVLMTPTGQSRAVPSAVRAQPVAIAKLPPPRVLPKNAPPPPATPRPIPANRPAAGSAPVPSAPVQSRPAAPATVNRPAPAVEPAPVTRPAAVARPAPQPVQPKPESQPVRPAPRPVERPAPAPITRPAPTPQPPERPAPQPPVEQNRATPVRPAPSPAEIPQRPAPAKPQPIPPAQQNVRPAPKPLPKNAPRPEDRPKDEPKKDQPN